MMTQAFYNGLSGLKAHTAGINIVSDNIANISTAGFRGSDYEFSSLFNNMVNTTDGSVDSTVGLGTMLSASPLMKSIGSEMNTDKSTDMAISGNGWFGVQGEGDPLYTRDGNFSFDKNDNLVTADGYHVLGTLGKNISNNVLTKRLAEVPLGDVKSQDKLNFPKFLTYPPEATTIAKFDGNIGTEDSVQTIGATVIDSKGNRNDLRLKFTKDNVQKAKGTQWKVEAVVKSHDGKTVYDKKAGSVQFDESGALVSSSLSTINNNGSSVKIDLGKAYDGIVSIGNLETSSSSTANGIIGGDLKGYDINKNGEVIATFTNGIQSSVGKIAVYHFRNDQGLNRLSGTRFSQSSNSGDAMFFKDAKGANILGTDISNFKLEGSNVTMEHGLTNLIILQRSYDANAKSITTADQMIQKALNM